MTLNNNLFRRSGATLQDTADRLQRALRGTGYVESGFYCVPNGFALATRIERINNDARAWPGDDRWNAGRAPLLRLQDGFSLRRIVQTLFNADPGRYRMIVFYVTDRGVTPSSTGPTADYQGLPTGGVDELPEDFSSMPYGSNHRVKAFVYEFRRPSVAAPAQFVRPSLPTYTHLDRSGLLARLGP